MRPCGAGASPAPPWMCSAVEPPPPDFPLLHDERITITPHAGWYSEASTLDVRVKAIEDVEARL